MYISINWIKDFVDLDGIDIDNLIYKFTMSTAEVEGITKYGQDIDGVIVAQILSVENVENSKKLHKLVVDTGKEKLQVICGHLYRLYPIATALQTQLNKTQYRILIQINYPP